MSSDEADDSPNPQPLKRSVSDGSAVQVSGLYLSPGSPSGSDVSDSTLHVTSSSSSHLYRPVARTGGVFAPQLETTSPSNNDPPTSLSLSLPGIESIEFSNRVSESTHTSNPPPVPAPATVSLQAPPVPLQSIAVNPLTTGSTLLTMLPRNQEKTFMPFNAEFLGVMQEMIRKEVRNYMAGLDQQHQTAIGFGMGMGMCMQQGQ